MTATDLRNVTGQAIRLLLSGNLRPREASALAQLCNSLYRTIPTAALETRVANLERRIAQEESETLRNLDATRSPEGGALTGEAMRTWRWSRGRRVRTMIFPRVARSPKMEPSARAMGPAKPSRLAAHGREEAANFAASMA